MTGCLDEKDWMILKSIKKKLSPTNNKIALGTQPPL